MLLYAPLSSEQSALELSLTIFVEEYTRNTRGFRPHIASFSQQTALLPARATVEQVYGETKPPIGWLGFCQRYRSECGTPTDHPEQISLTPAHWTYIREVNSYVNGAIKPLSDWDHWGVIDQWDIPDDGFGDCEDYALLKRKLLHEAGYPLSALLMTVARDLNGDGHAILTIKTTRGDYVLDNLRNEVRPWDHTGYPFVKRQSQEDPIGMPVAR